MRAVLDPNVLIAGVLSNAGPPADVLRACVRGEFEVVVSARLIEELERALAYPKLRRHIAAADSREFVEWLRDTATAVADPEGEPPIRSRDPGDDYLLSLAASQKAALVTGDKDLLSLADRAPIYSARRFLEMLAVPRNEDDIEVSEP